MSKEYIKVRFTGGAINENLWAIPIGKKYAKLQNVPAFYPSYGQDDIVEIDDHGKVLRLVTKGTYTVGFTYGPCDSPDRISEAFNAIGQYFIEHDIYIEGSVAGHGFAAVPISVSPLQAKALFDAAPNITSYDQNALNGEEK